MLPRWVAKWLAGCSHDVPQFRGAIDDEAACSNRAASVGVSLASGRAERGIPTRIEWRSWSGPEVEITFQPPLLLQSLNACRSQRREVAVREAREVVLVDSQYLDFLGALPMRFGAGAIGGRCAR